MHYKSLKKYYFINNFNKENINRLNSLSTIIYREYSKKTDENLIIQIRDYCKKRKIKFFIANNIRLAIRLDLDGAYIPAFNKNLRHLCYQLKNKFTIIGSAHNIYEIRIKELQNSKKIFLSSLFKKNKNYLGINKFKFLQRLTNRKIIPLGGISKNNIKSLNLLNCRGFAGISYFEQKKRPL